MSAPLTAIADIIQQEMALAPDQVWLWDQKVFEPKDHRLYVVLNTTSCKPFGNSRVRVSDGQLTQEQATHFQATIGIDVFSRGTDARDRKEEVLMALKSQYSQAQQEKLGFLVAPITSGFMNLSQIEETAIPYRFNLTLNVQYAVTKATSVPYYDQFQDSSVLTDP